MGSNRLNFDGYTHAQSHLLWEAILYRTRQSIPGGEMHGSLWRLMTAMVATVALLASCDDSSSAEDASSPAVDAISPAVGDASLPVEDTSPPVGDARPPVGDAAPSVGDAAPPVEGVAIGPEGGELRFAESGSLVVHPGALTETLTISATIVPAPDVAGLTPAGVFVEFAPDGTEFAIPVDIALPFNAAAGADGLVVVWSAEPDVWTAMTPDIDEDSSLARIMVSHFSRGGAARPAEEADWVCCTQQGAASILPRAACAPEHTLDDVSECNVVCCALPSGDFERRAGVHCRETGGEASGPVMCPPGACQEDRHCAVAGGCSAYSCVAGECRYEPLGDGASCGEAQQCMGWACQAGVCQEQHADEGGPCEDRNPCTQEDQCVLGVCVPGPLSCDDRNDCTVDSCGVDGCENEIVNDGTECESPIGCGTTAECVDGHCVPEFEVNCDDWNSCTVDTCVGIECQHRRRAVGDACDDDDGCTVDETCGADGECAGGRPMDCEDGDPCTIGVCDDFLEMCRQDLAPAGTPCNDGDACTLRDACDNSGQCMGSDDQVPRHCEQVCCVNGAEWAMSTRAACLNGPGRVFGGDRESCRDLVCCLTADPGGSPWRTMPSNRCVREPNYLAEACDDFACCWVDSVNRYYWMPRLACPGEIDDGELACLARAEHELGAYYCSVGAADWLRVDLLTDPESYDYFMNFRIVTDWDGHMPRRIYIPTSAQRLEAGIVSTYDWCGQVAPDETTCDGVGWWAFDVDNPNNGGGGGGRILMGLEINISGVDISLRTEMWGWLDEMNMRDHNIDWNVRYECTPKIGHRIAFHRPDGGANAVRLAGDEARGFDCYEGSCVYLFDAELQFVADVVPGFRVTHWVDRDTGDVIDTPALRPGLLMRDYEFEVYTERVE